MIEVNNFLCFVQLMNIIIWYDNIFNNISKMYIRTHVLSVLQQQMRGDLMKL